MDIKFLFRKNTPAELMSKALEECNAVLLNDFGPRHRLESDNAPDLLVTGSDVNFTESTDDNNKVVGLLTMHYTEASRAWELGTVSARKTYSHNTILQSFMDRVPDAIVGEFMKDDTAPAWLVRRVKQESKMQINLFKNFGFEEPAHFMIGVLSNDGYIPFDPFDEVLLKRKLCPPSMTAQVGSVVFST